MGQGSLTLGFAAAQRSRPPGPFIRSARPPWQRIETENPASIVSNPDVFY
jgi:hypothetical protein